METVEVEWIIGLFGVAWVKRHVYMGKGTMADIKGKIMKGKHREKMFALHFMMEFADIFMILLWRNDAWECKGQVAKVVQGSMTR